MRLSKETVDIIKETAKEIYPDAEIWLFGSRVDDNKKGGDIDLFIETHKSALFEQQIKFLTKLERCGIERKVDLIVKSPDSKHKLIFDIAKQTGILL